MVLPEYRPFGSHVAHTGVPVALDMINNPVVGIKD